MLAAMFKPLARVCGWIASFSAEAIAAIRSTSVMPPAFDTSGWRTWTDAFRDEAIELEASEVVLVRPLAACGRAGRACR